MKSHIFTSNICKLVKFNINMKLSPVLKLLIITLTLNLFHINNSFSQRVPRIHSNIEGRAGEYSVQVNGKRIGVKPSSYNFSLENLQGNPKGTRNGILLDFGLAGLSGTLYYGFIPYGDSKHPHPVYFRSSAQIIQGKAAINISEMKGRYDMVGWEQSGKGTIGYRIKNESGLILYDGIVSFSGTGPFKIAETITEGPFVNILTSEGATISFETNERLKASVTVDGQTFTEEGKGTHHEILITGLNSNTEYEYTVNYGDNNQTYSFRTAPDPGTRSSFSFAYASDSRSGQGGGERDVYGANFYIMKKIMALATQQDARFFQFSGDMIDGYLSTKEETAVQYANWKRAVEPFGHYFPIYLSMGNHEALMYSFQGDNASETFFIDKFPFETESAEAAFAEAFVSPTNGPESEDGASYDPDDKRINFPSYKENVYYYTYDNVAVVVMNSDYWYAPSTQTIPTVSGGLHGYIMDVQLKWFEETIEQLEQDANIDHVFVTQHTPFFPNGGHTRDDMWYSGNNEFRPYVAGEPLEKGIIERRDQLLDIIMNQSSKVIAILTGDEHNYARTEISSETNIYPDNWSGDKVELSRTIYQINNGAAGAPYYAQEQTPWTPMVSGFTTQNALVFFDIDGENISMRVLNPDTLEEVDQLEMR